MKPEARHQVPWVTLVLILGNLVVALLAILDPSLALQYAFDPVRPTFGAALASLFLHANIVHLLGNMLFLAAVGPRVESAVGRLGTAAVYFVGGLAGVAAHWGVMRTVGGSAPLLGASGAIAGLAGYCAVRFLSRRVPLAPKLNASIGTVMLVWAVLQAVGALVRVEGQGGPAFWTHLAGFCAGILLSLLFRAHQEASLQFGHDVLERMEERGPAALAEAAKRHLERHPGDRKAMRRLAKAQHQMGDRDHEADTLLRLFTSAPEAAKEAALLDLGAAGGWRLLPAASRVRLAEAYPGLAKDLLRSVTDDPETGPSRADALLALALLEEGEARAALLRELQESFALHDATQAARQRGLIP